MCNFPRIHWRGKFHSHSCKFLSTTIVLSNHENKDKDGWSNKFPSTSWHFSMPLVYIALLHQLHPTSNFRSYLSSSSFLFPWPYVIFYLLILSWSMGLPLQLWPPDSLWPFSISPIPTPIFLEILYFLQHSGPISPWHLRRKEVNPPSAFDISRPLSPNLDLSFPLWHPIELS